MNVLFEDNHIIVAVKPQNVPSQRDISGDADMLSMVKEYVRKKYNKPGEAYIGLVHRLDRPTGGIMVFARTSKAAKRLQQQIKNGEFKKTYLAVTAAPEKNSARLESWLRKDEKTNTVSVADEKTDGAKYAALRYEVMQKQENTALVRVELETGRSHQIRVQMASIGAPLAGDAKYGTGGGQLCLWAHSLSFIHPTKKERLSFSFPPPDAAPWSDFSIVNQTAKQG